MLAKLRELRLLWPALMTLAAMPILMGLGYWQLQRKEWKEALISSIEKRSTAAPVPIKSIAAPPFDAANIEYTRVEARGRLHHDKERYYYAPSQQLGPGFHVYTPFELADSGNILFVNRGFVPEALKDPQKRIAGSIEGETTIVGLVRTPERQGLFTLTNDTKNNLWFWRDFSGMLASAFEGAERPFIPLFVDVEGEAPGGWPKGSATLRQLPNRHLEYALTWFGLAVTLLGVFAAYVVSQIRGSKGDG